MIIYYIIIILITLCIFYLFIYCRSYRKISGGALYDDIRKSTGWITMYASEIAINENNYNVLKIGYANIGKAQMKFMSNEFPKFVTNAGRNCFQFINVNTKTPEECIHKEIPWNGTSQRYVMLAPLFAGLIEAEIHSRVFINLKDQGIPAYIGSSSEKNKKTQPIDITNINMWGVDTTGEVVYLPTNFDIDKHVNHLADYFNDVFKPLHEWYSAQNFNEPNISQILPFIKSAFTLFGINDHFRNICLSVIDASSSCFTQIDRLLLNVDLARNQALYWNKYISETTDYELYNNLAFILPEVNSNYARFVITDEGHIIIQKGILQQKLTDYQLELVVETPPETFDDDVENYYIVYLLVNDTSPCSLRGHQMMLHGDVFPNVISVDGVPTTYNPSTEFLIQNYPWY